MEKLRKILLICELKMSHPVMRHFCCGKYFLKIIYNYYNMKLTLHLYKIWVNMKLMLHKRILARGGVYRWGK